MKSYDIPEYFDMFFTVMSDHNEPIRIHIPSPLYNVITKTGSYGGILLTCRISVGEKVREAGYAVCHPNDRFDYEFGAKLALKRALRNVNFSTFIYTGKTACISKFDRKKVWDEFYRRIHDGNL